MIISRDIHSLARISSALLFSCAVTLSYAQEPSNPLSALVGVDGRQELTLFESVEATENNARTASRANREARVTTAEPEFTLVGVSRIGGSYSAILRHRDGSDIRVKADPFGNTLIPQHRDYAIVGASAGSVSIRYPSNNACIEFSDRGVSCNSAGNIAELVLATGEPLAPRNPVRGDSEADVDSSEEVIAARSDPNNPFEVLRNARRMEAGDATGNTPDNPAGRFTPRRINPEDVPDGYRVVATPFGDRLVEQ